MKVYARIFHDGRIYDLMRHPTNPDWLEWLDRVRWVVGGPFETVNDAVVWAKGRYPTADIRVPDGYGTPAPQA